MLIALTIVLIASYVFLLTRILRARQAPPSMAVYLVSAAAVSLLRISALFYISQVLHNHAMESPFSFLRYLLLPEALLLSDVCSLLDVYPPSAFVDSVLLALFLIVGSFLLTSPLLILVTRKD
jgi:hypothetical protein